MDDTSINDSIKWTPLTSGHLEACAYTKALGLLVRFQSGAVYRYGAPEAEYVALTMAPSAGTYLKRVLAPRYPGTRIA